jgi:hypothetical protein
MNFSPQFNNSPTMTPSAGITGFNASGGSGGGSYSASGFVGAASQNAYVGVTGGVSGGFNGSGQFGRPQPSVGLVGGFRF